MSVGLGDIKADGDCEAVEVSASNYDADELQLEQDDGGHVQTIVLTRRQLQQLSIIVDRFQDR